MKRAIFIILTAVLAASCIYQFEPEGIVSQRRVVIEGDILIGGQTTVTVSSTQPILYEEDFDQSSPLGKAWIEDSKGRIYEDLTIPQKGKSTFTFNTEKASADLSYRLHFKDYGTGNEYVSGWEKVVKAPEIKNMSFDYDAEKVNIRMDVDGGDTDHFRWDYREDWEYHAEYAPTYYFDPQTSRVLEYNEGLPDYSMYYCWDYYISKEFGLASTEKQSANRLEGQIIATHDRTNLRFQSYYRMDVSLMGLTKDAYDYLHNMREISDITGSLFAASPDDMRGNIVCQQDTTEFVIGYISAVQLARQKMYIPLGENIFYKGAQPTQLTEPELGENETILDYYNNGHRPVIDIPAEILYTVGWGPESCINCVLLGGSKNRPDDWPTQHE